jgi:hypothetical protein
MPKAALKEPKAPAKDRDLTQDQLLYAIILQIGTPSGGEAWAQVAARVPNTAEAEAARGAEAVRGRWNRLKAKWDANLLFGEKHFDITEEANELRGQPKKEKKKAGVSAKKTKAKGTGKGKVIEGKASVAEDQDEDVEDEAGQTGDDNGGEGSSRAAASVKKLKEKKKRVEPLVGPAPVEEEEEEEEESGEDIPVEQEV